MAEEKTFTFQEKEEGKQERTITVRESELTNPQKEKLLLELVHKWDSTPAQCQHAFVEMLTEVIKEVKKKSNKASSIIKLHKP